MSLRTPLRVLLFTGVALGIGLLRHTATAQDAAQTNGPDPREIPVPPIKTPIGHLPGVEELPLRKEMPDVLVTNGGSKVTTRSQWQSRREEMRRMLAYYAVGQMPPPPGNVKGKVVKSETVLDGTVNYRLVHLTFGPAEKLGLDIGIFTPAEGGPFPAIILQGGTPPGAHGAAPSAAGAQPGTRRRRVAPRGSRARIRAGCNSARVGQSRWRYRGSRWVQRSGHRAIHRGAARRRLPPRLRARLVQSERLR